MNKYDKVLETYRLGKRNLFVIGSFDSGITVLSQQIRALNLAWALVENRVVAATHTTPRTISNEEGIAVIGAGFAGLTLCAALMRKGCTLPITLFERRDGLLPMQQGSDARWLHPQIYNWPKEHSETTSAYLPVLNWTAGRASDVVVQVLQEWKAVLHVARGECTSSPIEIFANVKHLQVHDDSDKLQIEWVGDRVSLDGEPARSVGQARRFSTVVLAVGFGLEADEAHSYWRNESYSQPSLDVPVRNYIVSGQGDGAVIDLLRLRISGFRQDRILSELFANETALVKDLRELSELSETATDNLFPNLERLFLRHDQACRRVIEALSQRLRNDTRVIMRTKQKRFSDLFLPTTVRLSFQNRLMLYLLYRAGGFSPSSEPLDSLK